MCSKQAWQPPRHGGDFDVGTLGGGDLPDLWQGRTRCDKGLAFVGHFVVALLHRLTYAMVFYS